MNNLCGQNVDKTVPLSPAESQRRDTTSNLLFALSVITLIGSFAAAGLFYSQLGNASFAIAGTGLTLSLIAFLVGRYCLPVTCELRREDSQQKETDKPIEGKILLKNYGKAFETNLEELRMVAKEYFPDGEHKEEVLQAVDRRLRSKEFQKDPINYVQLMIQNKPNGPIEHKVLDFFCALLRDMDSNINFPWNKKNSEK